MSWDHQHIFSTTCQLRPAQVTFGFTDISGPANISMKWLTIVFVSAYY
jgi:hypothetical protein